MDLPETEVDVRRWLAAQLDVAYFSEWLWDDPDLRDDVAAYLKDRDEKYLHDALWLAGKLLRGARARDRELQGWPPLSAHAKRPRERMLLTEYEKAHLAALSAHIANVAAIWPPVRRFRKEVLGNQLLIREQADRFMLSPAMGFFEVPTLRQLRVPIRDHRAVITADEELPTEPPDSQELVAGVPMVRPKRRLTVYIEPPGITRSVKVPGSWRWKGRSYPARDTYLIGDTWHEFEYWYGTPMDKLIRLVGELTETYPWRPLDALLFVLTGATAEAIPLRIGTQPAWQTIRLPGRHQPGEGYETPGYRGKITLELEAWLSAETVTRAYRLAQRQLLSRPRKSPDLRTINVFRFVSERIDAVGSTQEWHAPPWRELWAEWNEWCRQEHPEHPEWPFREHRTFRGYYLRARRYLLFTPYGLHAERPPDGTEAM